jgi:hypothetical protein
VFVRPLPLCVAAGLLLFSADAFAFECTLHAPACFASVHWTHRTIPYVIRAPETSTIERDRLIRAVDSAFFAWSSVGCTRIRFEYRGFLSLDAPSDVENEVVVVTDGFGRRPQAPETAATGSLMTWSEATGDDVLAITRVRYDPDTGVVSRARIELNDETARLVDASLGCGESEYDLEAVLTHEVGHFLGLAHPCEYPDEAGQIEQCPSPSCYDKLADVMESGVPTMWPVADYCDIQLRTLTGDDVDGICFLYPSNGEDRQCVRYTPGHEIEIANVRFGCTAGGEIMRSSALWTLALFAIGLALKRR